MAFHCPGHHLGSVHLQVWGRRCPGSSHSSSRQGPPHGHICSNLSWLSLFLFFSPTGFRNVLRMASKICLRSWPLLSIFRKKKQHKFGEEITWGVLKRHSEGTDKMLEGSQHSRGPQDLCTTLSWIGKKNPNHDRNWNSVLIKGARRGFRVSIRVMEIKSRTCEI